MYWIAFGDVHERTELAARIPGIREAAGVIVSGDLTNRGGAPKAKAVFEAIAAINPKILAQQGNMDTDAVGSFLDARGVNLHRQAVELAPGLGIMGVGWSTPTPFGTPSEIPEATLAAWIEETYAQAKGFAHLICVIHEPPANTALDLVGGRHVGSPAVRAFLERAQPEVCITGHIHESRGEERLGKTLAINPGALGHGGFVRIDYAEGRLTAVLRTV
jgi:Icc-related predicted phosphoesterase